MMLIVSGAATSTSRLCGPSWRPLPGAGHEAISLAEVRGPRRRRRAPTSHVTVYGVDHPGIVHAISAALAQCEVNITT